MAATKGLIALGGAGVLGVATVIGVQQSSTTPIVPNTIASEGAQTEYTGKYGEYFKHHFVSAKDDSNKAWWDEAFQRLSVEKAKQSTDMSTEFKAAEASTGTDTNKSLNQICLTSYKLEYSGLTTGNKTNYLRDLWKYCSLEKEQPEVVGATDDSNGSTIKDKHKSKIVSLEEGKNQKFWEIQEETFFKKGTGTDEKAGLGQHATDTTIFKPLYTNKETSAHKTLKAACKAAHSSTDTNNVKADAIRFCSIAGKVNG